MFDVNKIQTCLEAIVGFRQNTNPQFKPIDDSLTSTDCGIYVNHSLTTIANIDQTLETTDPDYYDEYDNAKQYTAGDRVKGVVGTDFTIYEAKIATLGNPLPVPPATENTEWLAVDPLSEYLTQLRLDSIAEVFNDVYNKKKINEEVKDVFENVPLFKDSGRINDNITNLDNLVGFEVQLRNQQYLTLVLNRISTQLTQNQTLPIYIYHSSQNEPIATFNVTYDAGPKSSQWHEVPEVEKVLEFTAANHDIGGTFYICYKQSELTGQAINKDYDPYRRPCACPPHYDGRLYDLWNPYYVVRPFQIAEAKLPNGTDLWDIGQTQYTCNTNYGLNLEFSLKCDVSTFICQNKCSFAEAVKYKIEVRLLEMLKYNLRVNKTAEKVKSLANIELQDVDTNPNNIQNRYMEAAKAVNFDLSQLKTACVPCTNNTWGSKISGI